jgi:hypothetical protein
MNDYKKQMEDFVAASIAALPKVTPTPTGYELRMRMLELAQTQAFEPINMKMGKYSAETNWEADEIVAKFTYPGADEVMKIAEQFNDFVSGNKPKTDK